MPGQELARFLHPSIPSMRPSHAFDEAMHQLEAPPEQPRAPDMVFSPGRPELEDPLEQIGAFQRRVAQLKAAGCSSHIISTVLECSEEKIVQTLRSHKVQKLILKLNALATDDIKPAIQEVNELIADSLKEAYQVEIEVMRRSFNKDSIDGDKLSHTVAASLLDRGGAAAPKRIESKSTHLNLGAENIANIAKVLQELDAI